MKKIFKYDLPIVPIENESTLLLPAGANILSVESQSKSIVLYAMVDPDTDLPKKVVNIRIIGTGRPVEFDTKDFQFLGTVKMYNGELMFHVFVHDNGYAG